MTSYIFLTLVQQVRYCFFYKVCVLVRRLPGPPPLSPRPAVARLSPGCPAAAAVRCRLMRGCLLALLLLMALGLESWPEARLALGFALARGSWLGILA